MNTVLKMILKNIFRNPRRSLLTLFSVAIGCMGIILAMGYSNRMESYFSTASIYWSNNGHIVIYKQGGIDKYVVDPDNYSFSKKEYDTIVGELKKLPEFFTVAPYFIGTGLISNGCKTAPFRAVGTTPEISKWLYNHKSVRRDIPEVAKFSIGDGIWSVDKALKPITISPKLASIIEKTAVVGSNDLSSKPKSFFSCDDKNAIEIIKKDPHLQLLAGDYNGSFSAIETVVSGNISTGFSDYESMSVQTDIKTLQELYDTDYITYISVFFKNDNDIEEKLKSVKTLFNGKNLKLDIYKWTEEAISPNYTSFIDLLNILKFVMYGVTIGVVLLSLVNSMTMSVIERSREFGSLRAIGFTPRYLLLLLAGEMTILSLFGCIIGSLGGLVLSYLINASNIRFEPPNLVGDIQFLLTPNSSIFINVLILIVITNIIATVIAARKHLNKKVVILLYGETG